jgi:surface antigen Omp85-like protein
VLGARLDAGYVAGPSRAIPFWELESLGGNDTLRGFFPRRFLGTTRVLLNLEYRFRLTEFDFFDLWHVRMDGVAFGDAGRVFIDDEELEDEFRMPRAVTDRVTSDVRYSYGGGLLFAVSQALAARVNVAFSEEETALVYLEFGQTF